MKLSGNPLSFFFLNLNESLCQPFKLISFLSPVAGEGVAYGARQRVTVYFVF